MRITEIVVSAGRTFNHPFESYSNLRPQITIKAEVLEGEDASTVAKQLQAQAEGLVEDHKRNMLRSIEELHDMTQRQYRIASLQETVARAQRELDDARNSIPGLQLESVHDAPPEDEDEDEDEDDIHSRY